ncbi:McrBC 5-methylcytosine restriction system component [Sphaerisporangium rufum]|uniref:McrBC 5-methylcytosine restriction system component n=1 Tax=Sphaerisporangium rufum TaxID=1381558 RepID=A0A919V0Z7_9ACTN|nr:hypothetical protein [Sphaerisporangium rufum]GII79229.1 McrBC 5-methylcytosine restriction system component [Sphaerisporangium rufum]
MTCLRLTEGTAGDEATFSPETARRLREDKIADVTSLGGHRWRVKPLLKVGAIRFPDLELHIRPKISISRLWFLLGFAYDKVQQGWQEREVTATEHPDLLAAMAYAFLQGAANALKHGLPHGYRRESRALPVVRGRIREADQLRRHHGRLFPVEVDYQGFTNDVPETQVLRAATERLLALPGVDPKAEARLRDLLARLRQASPSRPGVVPRWVPGPANLRYRTVLGLADVILRGGSLEFGTRPASGSPVVNGLLVQMDKIFEDFLHRALEQILISHGGTWIGNEAVKITTNSSLTIKPDIRWVARQKTQAVIDAKYSDHTDKARDYRFQVITYCAALECLQGHIVYAGGPQGSSIVHHRLRGRLAIDLYEHRLDLAAPLSSLRDQIQTIAELMLANTTTVT